MKRFLHTSLLIILTITWAAQKGHAQSCVPANNCSSDADILLDCPDIGAWTDYFWDVRELGKESDPLASIPELIREDGGDYYFTPSGVTDALSGVQVSVVLIEGTSNASSLGQFAKRVRVFKSPESYGLTGPDEVCIGELFTLQLADTEASTTSYALWGGTDGGTYNELDVINGQNGAINFDQTNFAAGDYNYYVIADNGQCTSTMPDPDPDNGWKVKVNDVPSVTLSSDQPGNEFCQGTDVTFTASGANEYAFYLNSTGNEVQARSADATYNTATLNDGDVIIVEGYDTATSAITTCTASDDITVIVNDLPTGDISGDNTVCDGETTDLTFVLTGVAPWDIVFTDGTTDYNITANTTPFDHTITPAAGVNTYTIKSLTDSKSCGAATLTGSATITVNDRPSSTISGGGTICNGENATFDITMTGAGPFTVTYSDGTTDITLTDVASPQTVTVNPSATATYFIKTLVDQNCTAQASDMPGSVTVDVNPRPTSTITGGGTICDGESATFDITMIGTGPFTVTYSDGTTDVTLTDVASPQTITVNPSATATYFVKALADQNCTAQAGDMPGSVTVDVNSRPTSTITGGGTICNGESSTFDITMTGTGPFTVTYTDGTTPVTLTNVTSPQTITVNPSSTTTYSVIALSDAVCSAQAVDMPGSVTVDVNPRPTSTISGGGTICDGGSATFDIVMTGTGPFTVTYTDGTTPVTLTNVASPQTITVNPSTTTTYSVTALSDAVCTSQAGDMPGSVTVTVNDRPTSTITGGGTICDGDDATITINMAGAGPFTVTYTDGVTPVTLTDVASPQVITVNPSSDATYSVTALSDQSCSADALAGDMPGSATVIVNNRPTGTISGGGTICLGDSETFDIVMTGTGPFTVTYTDGTTPVTLTNVPSPQTVTVAPGSTATYTLVSLSDALCTAVPATDLSGSAVVTVNNVTANISVSAPVAGGTEICAGTTVIFNAAGVGGTGPYNYDFHRVRGASDISVQNSTTATYSDGALQDGDVIYVIVTDNATTCFDQSADITMTVNANPVVALNITNPSSGSSTVCIGTNVEFTATPGYDTYDFYLNGGLVQSSVSNTYANNTLTTGDQIFVEATEGSCRGSSVPPIIMTVNTLPTPTLVSDQAGNIACPAEEVTFTAGGGVLYEFFVDGFTQGAPDASTELKYTHPTNNPYNVTVTVTDVNGCIATSTPLTITFDPATAGLTADKTTICADEDVTFTATGGVLYEFFVGAASVQGPGAADIYVASGLTDGQVVTVEVTNANGCTDTHVGIPVTVTSLPVAGITSSDADNTICAGDEVTFTGSGGAWYEFFVNGISVGAGSATNTYTTSSLVDGDRVSVNVAVSAGGCSAMSAELIHTVNPLPTPGLVSDIDPATTACPGQDVTFTASGGVSYQFILDDVAQGVPDANATFVHTTAGDFKVEVLVIDGNTCQATSSAINITEDAATAGLTADRTTICSGDDVTFTATGGVTYEFLIDDVPQVVADPTDDTFVASGLTDGQVVKVKVTNATGCEDTHAGIAIAVNTTPNPVITSGPDNVCNGESATYTAEAGYVNYVWSVSGGTITSDPILSSIDVDWTVDGAGEVKVIYESAAGCVGAEFVLPVTVNALPAVTTFIAAPSNNVIKGTDITFTASGGTEYAFYKISGGISTELQARSATDNIVVSTEAPSANPVLLHGDIVRVYIYNAAGCNIFREITVGIYDGITGFDVIASEPGHCFGGSIASIRLTGFQPDITYELFQVGPPDVSLGKVLANAGTTTVEWLNVSGTNPAAQFYVVAYYDGTPPTPPIEMNNRVLVEEYADLNIYNLSPTTDQSCGDVIDVTLDGSDAGVDYQLLNGANVIATQTSAGGPLTFAGVNLSVGTYSINAIKDNGGVICQVAMNGSFNATGDPAIDTSFEIQGTKDGQYCDDGSDVVTLSLNDSQTGYNYELYYNNAPIAPIPVIVPGTDASISFGDFTIEGDYSVVLQHSGCTYYMNGVVTVSRVSLPVAYNLVAEDGGHYCANDADGVELTLDISEPTISYQLLLDGNPVGAPITGGILTFGNHTAEGAYSVEASTGTPSLCIVSSNTINVIKDELPTKYAVLSDGDFCSGQTTFLHIDNSDTDVEYYWYNNDDSSEGPAITGTGGRLDFELVLSGNYHIRARALSGANCVVNMNDTPIAIAEKPLPDNTILAEVTDPGADCANGAVVTVRSSEPGVSYTLVKQVGAVYVPVVGAGYTFVGDGTDLDFAPIIDISSTYSVLAELNGCTDYLNDVSINVAGAIARQTLTTTLLEKCNGEPDNPVYGLEDSEDGVSYQLMRLDGSGTSTPVGAVVPGSTGNPITFGEHSQEGTYYVTATSATCTVDIEMNNRITFNIHELPTAFSMVGSGKYCDDAVGAPIQLEASEDGVSYQLQYLEGGVLTDIGAPVIAGPTTGTIDFGYFTEGAGTYTVVAISPNTCTSNMKGSIIVEKVAGPTNQIIEGEAPYVYCADGSTGFTVTLTNQEEGTIYELVKTDETPELVINTVVGGEAGSSLLLGEVAFGTYAVYASYPTPSTVASTCRIKINDRDGDGFGEDFVVTSEPQMPIISPDADTGYCAGEDGVEFSVLSTQSGVGYQLVDDSGTTVSFVEGTDGEDKVFANKVTAGTYHVVAKGLESGCEISSSSVTITESEAPAEFNVSIVDALVCSSDAVVISLDGSETGVDYRVVNEDDHADIKATVSGTGSGLNISFLETELGEMFYTVIASKSGLSCEKELGMVRAELILAPTAPVVEPTNDMNYCWGTEGVKVSLTAVEAGVDYYIVEKATGNRISFLSGDAGVLEFKEYVLAGTYYVTAKSFDSGCANNSTDFTIGVYSEIQLFNMRVGNETEGYRTVNLGETEVGSVNVDYIGLDNSTVGVRYTLLKENTPYAPEYVLNSGIGSGFVYPDVMEDGGLYTILADQNGCESLMAGTVRIEEKPLVANDTVVAVTKGTNEITVAVHENDDLERTVLDLVGTNIKFSLINPEVNPTPDPRDDNFEFIGNMDTGRGNKVTINADTGELLFVKSPSFYGRDSINYLIYNIDYTHRFDQATVYFFVGNVDVDDDNNLLIPNAFSPNGDTFNDKFIISGNYGEGKESVAESKLEIYNRWGSIIYRSKGAKYGDDGDWWDGTSNAGMVSLGSELPSGTYFYVYSIKINDKETGIQSKEFSGFIELRR